MLAQKNIFYFVVLGFKAERFSLELHLTMHVKRYLFIRVLFEFSLTKAFKIFFTDKVDLKNKNSFAKMVVMEYFYNP